MNISDARNTGLIGRVMIGASARLNYQWALRQPGKPPYVILTEFPRSGGNWIRDAIGDAVQFPVPRFSRYPITFKSIVHSHDHRPTMHPTLYVIRDPRDVFVSHFHKTANAFISGKPSLQRRILRLHPSFKRHWANIDKMDLMTEQYYKEWLKRPLGSRVGWGKHATAFLQHKGDNVTIIRYEDMKRDAVNTLSTAVLSLTGYEVDPKVIEFSIMRNTFESQTGRKTGEKSNKSTKRRGIVGSWRDELPKVILDHILKDLRDEMAMAGYTNHDK